MRLESVNSYGFPVTGADRTLVLVGGAIMLVPSLSPPPHPLSKKPKKIARASRGDIAIEGTLPLRDLASRWSVVVGNYISI